MRTTILGPCLIVALVAVLPSAAAHPADVVNIPFPMFAPPNGLMPFAPALVVGPATITGVTSSWALTGFPIVGASDCTTSTGATCLILPAINPNTFAPTFLFDCEVTAALGPWMTFGFIPEITLVQDLDGDNILGSGPDVWAGPIGFAWGNPMGPIPAFGVAGAVGGSSFAPFAAGVPVHVLLGHSGTPLGPWSALLSATVTCIVL